MTAPWDIVLFSMVDFDFLWQRPQQLMYELWRRGARVLFVEPPAIEVTSSGVAAFFRKVFKVRCVEDSFYVYKPAATFYMVGQLRFPLKQLRDTLSAMEISSLLKKLKFGSKKPLIFWINDPFLFTPHIKGIFDKANLLVYDCIDKWSAFETNLPQVEYIIRNEASLASTVDIIFATSRALQRYLKKYSQHVYLARNAADPHFAITRDVSVAADMTVIKRPIVGYVGSLSSWMDWELLYSVGRQLTGFSFVFVGPVKEKIPRRILELSNFHFLGPRPYAELPSYLKGMDACIIPFKVNQLTIHVDPVKLYEYQAARKPVVTVALPEIVNRNNDSISLAKTPYEFSKMLELAVSSRVHGERIRRPSHSVAENSWKQRADEITAILQTHFKSEFPVSNR